MQFLKYFIAIILFVISCFLAHGQIIKKPEFLVVILNTRTKEIRSNIRKNRMKDAKDIQEFTKNEIMQIKNDFTANFNFCTIYFISDTAFDYDACKDSSMQVLQVQTIKGDSVILSNINSKQFFITDISYYPSTDEEDILPYLPNAKGLVIYNKRYMVLKNNYLKFTSGIFKINLSNKNSPRPVNEFEGAAVLHKKLTRFYRTP